MTFDEFLAARSLIEIEVKRFSDALNSYPKGAMGLTPDSVKQSPAWQAAYKSFHCHMGRLRKINTYGNKVFKSELRELARSRRQA